MLSDSYVVFLIFLIAIMTTSHDNFVVDVVSLTGYNEKGVEKKKNTGNNMWMKESGAL